MIEEVKQQNIIQRIFDSDPNVWTDDKSQHEEIRHRLSWLHAPKTSLSLIDEIVSLKNDCLQNGFTHLVVLGMGGSSLAPEVFASILGGGKEKPEGLKLSILDSTHPRQVQACSKANPLNKTLFIVASKSGSTSETLSMFKYFWGKLSQSYGERTGEHFVAITDPGSKLEKMANEKGFRKIFFGDPDVGGRYSALTAFGLVPAGLMGIDLNLLLDKAGSMAEKCKPAAPIEDNPGAVLGAMLAKAAFEGKNKLTLITDPELSSFGSWAEQLIAESSGKIGKGIIPVDIEPSLSPEKYSHDRLFVYLSRRDLFAPKVEKLVQIGHPVFTVNMKENYDLGAEYYRWEFATAVACALMKINAFDQPNVQESKTLTKNLLTMFTKSGKLTEPEILKENSFGKIATTVDLPKEITSLADNVAAFIDLAKENDYLAINAFIPRNGKTLNKIQNFREYVLKQSGKAVTMGFGPRFLHSTGQLHKGGPDSALFIQILDKIHDELPIPGEDYSFKTLLTAQAYGDYQALASKNKKVIFLILDEADISDLIV